MAKIKVALVLSGGVSLGSYIAGALDELMQAFAASDNYEIDIITGASAGATTAALIAHGLLYREGKTALHEAWVEKVDIVDLLAPDLPRDEFPTLLTSAPLQRIAQDVLIWPNPEDRGKPASFCADTLTVAMTIANTTSLSYVSQVKQRAVADPADPDTSDGQGVEAFVQNRSAEQQTFHLGWNSHLPTDAIWQRISDVARASAAIPFVFPAVPLPRTAQDPTQYIHTPEFEGTRTFWYYDGGTFNNLPVDLAWHYVRINHGGSEGEATEYQDRVIIVVNPWRKSLVPLNQDPVRPTILQQAGGLLGALLSESSTIQFNREILVPGSRSEAQGKRESLIGVDRPDVELLDNVVLVMPARNAGDLRGNHMHALGAFLDRRFREYDFRRGAADAQKVAEQLLGIQYDAGHPPGYYDPDQDPTLLFNISDYAALTRIPSFRDPNRSIHQLFQQALEQRLNAMLDHPMGQQIVDQAIALVRQRWGKTGLVRFGLSNSWVRGRIRTLVTRTLKELAKGSIRGNLTKIWKL